MRYENTQSRRQAISVKGRLHAFVLRPRPGTSVRRRASAADANAIGKHQAYGHLVLRASLSGASGAGSGSLRRSFERACPAPSPPSNAAVSCCGPTSTDRKPSRCGDLGRLARAQDLSASVTVFTRWQPARSCESRPRWPATFPEENRTFRSSVDRELVS